MASQWSRDKGLRFVFMDLRWLWVVEVMLAAKFWGESLLKLQKKSYDEVTWKFKGFWEFRRESVSSFLEEFTSVPVLSGGRWGLLRARAGRRASSSSSWCSRRTTRTSGQLRCVQPSRRAPCPGRSVRVPRCTWSPAAVRVSFSFFFLFFKISRIINCFSLHGNRLRVSEWPWTFCLVRAREVACLTIKSLTNVLSYTVSSTFRLRNRDESGLKQAWTQIRAILKPLHNRALLGLN